MACVRPPGPIRLRSPVVTRGASHRGAAVSRRQPETARNARPQPDRAPTPRVVAPPPGVCGGKGDLRPDEAASRIRDPTCPITAIKARRHDAEHP